MNVSARSPADRLHPSPELAWSTGLCAAASLPPPPAAQTTIADRHGNTRGSYRRRNRTRWSRMREARHCAQPSFRVQQPATTTTTTFTTAIGMANLAVTMHAIVARRLVDAGKSRT